MKSKSHLMALALVFSFLLAAGAPPAAAQDQSQSEQKKPEKESKEKQKGGDFLGGLRAVTGSGSEQKQLTATAGSKTIGEDAQGIIDAQPTAADRAAVTSMENYSVPKGDLSKFQSDGELHAAK